jgi:hypothetical protein
VTATVTRSKYFDAIKVFKSHRGIHVYHGINVDQHSKQQNKCKYSICTCFVVLSVDLHYSSMRFYVVLFFTVYICIMQRRNLVEFLKFITFKNLDEKRCIFLLIKDLLFSFPTV